MKTQHVHVAMIKEWAEDTSRVVEYFSSAGRWIKDSNPSWHPDLKFRFRHKHQDLIDQKAARPELIVEMKTRLGVWVRMDMVLWDMVLWDENNEYRLVEPRHKHQDLIDRKKARLELIVETKSDDAWVPIGEAVMWFKDSEYRLVEPPKKKVKMWQWIFVTTYADTIITNCFYRSEKDAQKAMIGRSKVIQRADWTEIEVDE